MATVTVKVCDVCGTQEGVQTYKLESESQKAKVDLCATDGRQMEELISRFATGAPGATQKAAPRQVRRRPRSSAGANVTSMEEIEALKQE